jgi:CheY-like chemotaxis protein
MALRFLLVEPHLELRDHLGQLLTASYGAQVQACSDYASALEHARAGNPDLIVAAVGYPEDLGFVAAIRDDPATQFTPLVALTAVASEPADQLSLYDNGADAALLKPIKTEALLGRVDRLLRLRRDPDLALVHLGVETKDLDYKESVGLDCRDGRAALAKDVIAMANSGGGRIIVGIPEDDLAAFEPSRLNRALRDYLDPPVSVGVKQVRDGGRVFAILEVPPGAEMVILAGKENDRAGLGGDGFTCGRAAWKAPKCGTRVSCAHCWSGSSPLAPVQTLREFSSEQLQYPLWVIGVQPVTARQVVKKHAPSRLLRSRDVPGHIGCEHVGILRLDEVQLYTRWGLVHQREQVRAEEVFQHRLHRLEVEPPAVASLVRLQVHRHPLPHRLRIARLLQALHEVRA